MKRIIALTLLAALLLSGCSIVERANQRPSRDASAVQSGAQGSSDSAQSPDAAAETTAMPATEPTTVPTTEPTEPPFNPLNGEILDAPFDGRIFANTISNIRDAIPHVGVNQADILMEMFVNGSIIRCLALYTNIEDVAAIGSTRSTRLMFNSICQHYNAILSHAGGSEQCLTDATNRGLAHYNIDSLMRGADPLAQGTAYRDTQYKYGEHNLFGIGAGIKAYAEAQGVQVSGMPEVDYGLRFTDDGTPADGESAESITVTITYGKSKKPTTMKYDAELGKYVYYQYEQMMVDQITGETEAFQNVIIMHANITTNGIYHVADFEAGGEGYFACGGKIIPIKWECDSEDSPFRFLTMDGALLELGRGNTYIAICTPESEVVYE